VKITAPHIAENRTKDIRNIFVFLGRTFLLITHTTQTSIQTVDWSPTIVAIQMDGGTHGVLYRLIGHMGKIFGPTALCLIAQQASQKCVVMGTVFHTVENSKLAYGGRSVYRGKTSLRLTNTTQIVVRMPDWSLTIAVIQVATMMPGVTPTLESPIIDGKLALCLNALRFKKKSQKSAKQDRVTGKISSVGKHQNGTSPIKDCPINHCTMAARNLHSAMQDIAGYSLGTMNKVGTGLEEITNT